MYTRAFSTGKRVPTSFSRVGVSRPRHRLGELGKGAWGAAAPSTFFSTTPWFAPTSAPKTNPADNLDEVRVTAQLRPIPASDEMPVIEVEGRRIPWYVWLALGAAAVALLTSLRR